jgi:secreted trypsin-like serine protease
LINDKYVLTAAHCFYNVKSSELSNYFAVIAAQYRNDTNPVRFTIKSVILHNQYNDQSKENDIALLELTYRVDLDNPKVGFICLPPNNISTYPYAQMNATAIGWGRLEQGGLSSYTLQQVQFPVIPYTNEYCYAAVDNDAVQFCAGLIQGGKDTCQGDR